MPIDHSIDHARRLVLAEGRGVLSDEEIFAYQREVWSRADVAGYDELMDMTGVEQIPLPSTDQIMDLADLAAGMDTLSSSSKFAIVAPQDLAFGLRCMFEAYRGADERSTKQVAVFRTRDEAFAFLGQREETVK
jgi:hypothetical protein